MTVSLGGNIVENTWYRLTMDVAVSGNDRHGDGQGVPARDADGPEQRLRTRRWGTTLSFSGRVPHGVMTRRAEIGMAASAFGAMADSSVANFTIDP